MLLGALDKIGANRIPDAPAPRVQHHPDAIGLVEADLDEVIPGAKRAKVIGGACRATAQFVVLIDNRNEPSPQQSAITHDFPHLGRRAAPSPTVVAAPIIGSTMRNRCLYRRTDPGKIVG